MMHADQRQIPAARPQADPKLGRLVVVSLILHLAVVLVMSGGWLGSARRENQPVYYVDLIHKPVANPQAGRPEPRPGPKPEPAPVKQAPPPEPKPAPKPEPKPEPEPKPAPKPEPKPAAEVVKPTRPPEPPPRPEPRAADNLQQRLAEIRDKQQRQAEIDALKDRLARLNNNQAAATVPAEVPVGMPDGRGDEIGVSTLAYIQGVIKQNWALSPYLLDQSRLANIEARVSLLYGSDGTLQSFRVIEGSGDSQFDESIKKAIIKSKHLGQTLPHSEELTVTFNLKEMAAARR